MNNQDSDVISMISSVLAKTSGIPVALRNSKLIFGNNVSVNKTSVMTLEKLRPFLLDGDSHFRGSIVYRMYRRVSRQEDVKVFNKNRLRFDLTVLEKGRIGHEFVKTRGHYHPLKPGTTMMYPEIYEVIYGRALFIMQKADHYGSSVYEVYLVRASNGEKVVVPPDFGHVTVNIGSRPLVLSNVVSSEFDSNYLPFQMMRGACYHVLQRKGEPEIRRNRLYGSVPKPKPFSPKENFLSFSRYTPLYTTAMKNIGALKWLNYPEEFKEDLVPAKLFEKT